MFNFKRESQDDRKIPKFKFCFDAINLESMLGKLPIQYEANISSMLEKVEQNPIQAFDDLDIFDEPCEQNDQEIMNYPQFKYAQVSGHFDSAKGMPTRIGC